MDFGFTSQDEHERFLTAVAGTETGTQAGFPVILELRGAAIGTTYYYTIKFTMSKVQYRASTASLSGRDRIIQTVDFISPYNATDVGAIKIECTNITASYVTLA